MGTNDVRAEWEKGELKVRTNYNVLSRRARQTRNDGKYCTLGYHGTLSEEKSSLKIMSLLANFYQHGELKRRRS